MKPQEKGLFGEEQNNLSLRDLVNNYIKNWPVFLTCLIICIGAGVIYLRYAVPKYLSFTTFLVKESAGSRSNSNDLIDNALYGKSDININNEIMQFGSSNLMERTVAKNQFNISYLLKGEAVNIDVYKDAPFVLQAKHLGDSNRTYKFTVINLNGMGGNILYGTNKPQNSYLFKWNIPFNIEEQIFVLNSKKSVQKNTATYIVEWNPVALAASFFSKELILKPFDNKTSIVEASIKTPNIQKSKDVLNALFEEFNLSDIEERNKLLTSTVQFIDDRLLNISGELKGVEGNLENYQGSNQLVDIKNQSRQTIENSSIVERTIKNLAVQQSIVAMIKNYFSNPSNVGKLVPSSLGLDDATLTLLISQYNELQLKREREVPLVAPNSTVMQDLDIQIGSVKSSMLESLTNIDKNLRLQQSSFQGQNNQFNGFLSALPHNERVMQEIKRRQSITEGLYLYLLQKREESVISSTAYNVTHYKQIDTAKSYGLVEPNTINIILYTTLLGLFLAFGCIYIKELFNDKIRGRQDIEKKLPIIIAGDINRIATNKSPIITGADYGLVSEQFRTLRTNISLLLRNEQAKTILVTSAIKGEGKTLVSINLATVYALPGKKVALVEFNMRKPVLSNLLPINNDVGLTNYLMGKQQEFNKIYQVMPDIPSLHIYPCGQLPINTSDLLLSDNLSKLFDKLKANYDYIIIDTPPVKLVSDAIVLEKYSDLIIFVTRQNYTLKKHLDFISQISKDKDLSKMMLILNDVKNADNYS